MTSRWSALLVWGLAAAVAVYWALRLFVQPLPVPPQARLADNGVVLVGDLTRLLGAPPAKPVEAVAMAPDAASRFRLTGVVATRPSRAPGGPAAVGVALISVDGKPPQAYGVGGSLDAQWMLQSVGLRSARIGTSGGANGFVLELPPPVPPATGTPSDGIGGGMGNGSVPQMVPPPGFPAGFIPPQGPQGMPQGTMVPPTLQPPNPPQGAPSQGMQ